MRYPLMFLFFLLPVFLKAQTQAFPKDWTGNWKGELQWFKNGNPEPQKVQMELRIQPADSINKYTWNIIYGTDSKDNRPYFLVAKDSSGTHWVVDENNGILLDEYWIGQKLCGVFTVMNATIISKHWLEGEELIMEMLTIGAKPLVTTGKGNEDSPLVDSYRVNGYQLARLRRQ
jgi:hypothetical protein